MTETKEFTKAVKKVPIIIEMDNYDPDVKDGREFISVEYGTCNYGGACPGDTEEDMHTAIKSAIKTIEGYGDKPIIQDLRKSKTGGMLMKTQLYCIDCGKEINHRGRCEHCDPKWRKKRKVQRQRARGNNDQQ